MRVAVVGAGPAGAHLACLLAGRRMHVDLFDPKAPYEKPCGGGVTAKTLAEFPFLGEGGLGGKRIRRARVVSAGGLMHDFDLENPLTVFSRTRLGRGLLERATKAGARFHQEKVTDLVWEGGRWTLRMNGQKAEADILVGADGFNSLVRRRLLGPLPEKSLTPSFGYILFGFKGERIMIRFLREVPGYAWIFPRRSHASAGLLYHGRRLSAREAFDLLNRSLRLLDPGLSLDRARRFFSCIPTLPPGGGARHAGEHWLCVGDAAGLTDPATKEGIYYALRSADMAAEAIASGDLPSFDAACRRAFAREFDISEKVRDRLFTTKGSDMVLAAVRKEKRIERIAAEYLEGSLRYSDLAGRLVRTVLAKLFNLV